MPPHLVHLFFLLHNYDFLIIPISKCEDEDKERANVSMSMNITFAILIMKKKRKDEGRTCTSRITHQQQQIQKMGGAKGGEQV